MASSARDRMNFDDWAELAKSDPEAFETLRSKLIEETIEKASSLEQQRRLRGLQWRIEMLRACSKTPLAACVGVYEMMWDTLLGENGLAQTLRILSTEGATSAEPPLTHAKILPFERKIQDE